MTTFAAGMAIGVTLGLLLVLTIATAVQVRYTVRRETLLRERAQMRDKAARWTK